MTRHLLSLLDLEQQDFLALVARAAEVGKRGAAQRAVLQDRCIGILFRKTSTRTRTSFAAAAARLGACPIQFGPHDLQTETGESPEDTARVLSGYVDALVIRTSGPPQELRAMRDAGSIPVINAMTSDEHPTQALSDFAQLQRHFGRLQGLHVLYVGEGNNTAVALAYAAARTEGLKLTLITPPGFGLPPESHERYARLARTYRGEVSEHHDWPTDLPRADVIYATRWQTTGTVKTDAAWREKFAPLRVTQALFDARSTPRGVFMHDLPAVRGEDCDQSVLDGPRSIAFEQARQKMYTAMALLEWAIG